MKRVLIIGNANTGKTTLLNTLSKSEEHTGNWSGVTVEEKEKTIFYKNQKIQLVDLPGIYSLNAYSFEEEITIKKIFNSEYDLIINTLDISTLNKNLFLTLDLLMAGKKNMILAINKMQKKIISPEIKNIERKLGLKTIAINFDNKKDVLKLLELIENFSPSSTFNTEEIFYGNVFNELSFLSNKFDTSFNEIIKIFEKNNYFIEKNKKIIDFIEKNKKININLIYKQKYQFIDNLIKPTPKSIYGLEKIDKIILNKYLAVPIFFLIMASVFYLTFFSVGPFFSELISQLFQVKISGAVCGFLKEICSVLWIIDLIENGLFGGVGSLLAFLAQVVLLFLFLALIEETGYFARVSFVFEDLLNSVGLSGKSVYPLLMGFGCNASAILTTRSLDDRWAKIKTVMLVPYMNCSAKIPIFAVLGGAFFGAGNIFVICLLYLVGVFVAMLLSVVLDAFIKQKNDSAFFVEFPEYKMPKIKKVLSITWLNVKVFLIKVTTIFVSMTVIVWLLSNFTFSFEYVAGTTNKSMLQTLAEFLAPIFRPIGFDNWACVAALIAGVVAKEVIVSSLAIFNGIGSGNIYALQQSLFNSSSSVSFSAVGALSYMNFCMLYFPCLATLAVMKKEIGTKLTIFACGLQLLFAYVISFVIYSLYKLFNFFGFFNSFIIIFIFFLIVFAFFCVWGSLKCKNKCRFCKKCYF